MKLKLKTAPAVKQSTPTATPKKAVKKKPPVKAVKVEEIRRYEIPGLPHSNGPLAHSAPEILASTMDGFTVTMDYGTFTYVWQKLEKEAHHDHQKYPTPNIQRVAEEAVKAFRRTADNMIPGRAPAKKKLVLRVKK